MYIAFERPRYWTKQTKTPKQQLQIYSKAKGNHAYRTKEKYSDNVSLNEKYWERYRNY